MLRKVYEILRYSNGAGEQLSGGVGAGYVVQSARCCSIWFNAVASSPALGRR